ncbi:MAG: IPExxxVDY family protein [Bacteroidetes bacterium]|nr:IPExxxVDY family protein [Bacteroidota bacterium]
MAKKISLTLDFTSDYSVIGISCHLKDYRLTFNLNKELNLQLKRVDDFTLSDTKDESLNYSIYYYHCHDTNNNFSLVSNHHAERKLIPSLKKFDYFLLIQNNTNTQAKKELIKAIKKVPHILTAFEIELSKVKNIHTLIAEIELQFIENEQETSN